MASKFFSRKKKCRGSKMLKLNGREGKPQEGMGGRFCLRHGGRKKDIDPNMGRGPKLAMGGDHIQ